MLMVVKAVCDHVEDFSRSASCSATEEFAIANRKFTEMREIEPPARGEERLPEIAELLDPLRHVPHREVLDRTPRSTSCHVTGVDTVASGRGRTE